MAPREPPWCQGLPPLACKSLIFSSACALWRWKLTKRLQRSIGLLIPAKTASPKTSFTPKASLIVLRSSGRMRINPRPMMARAWSTPNLLPCSVPTLLVVIRGGTKPLLSPTRNWVSSWERMPNSVSSWLLLPLPKLAPMTRMSATAGKRMALATRSRIQPLKLFDPGSALRRRRNGARITARMIKI